MDDQVRKWEHSMRVLPRPTFPPYTPDASRRPQPHTLTPGDAPLLRRGGLGGPALQWPAHRRPRFPTRWGGTARALGRWGQSVAPVGPRVCGEDLLGPGLREEELLGRRPREQELLDRDPRGEERRRPRSVREGRRLRARSSRGEAAHGEVANGGERNGERPGEEERERELPPPRPCAPRLPEKGIYERLEDNSNGQMRNTRSSGQGQASDRRQSAKTTVGQAHVASSGVHSSSQARSKHLVDEPVHVIHRPSSGPRRGDGAPPELGHAASHLSPLLPLHGLPYERLHVVAAHVVIDLHADAPLGALVPAVGLLLGEKWPAHHGHAAADALQRGVPSRVSEEHPHGLVPQHRRLRAPRGQHAPPLGRGRELRRQPRGVALDEVWAHVPQEGVAGVGEPPRELGQLLVAHHRDAPEVDVDDGARRAAVQPPERRVLLLPQVGGDAHDGAVGGHVVPHRERERAHGVDGREQLGHGVQQRGVELVEGVDDDRGRLRHAGRLVDEEVEHDVVGVRGAHEAGEVAQLQVLGRAGDPVDDGVPQVAVGELLLVLERDETAVDEVAVVVVAEEAAGAGGPERGAAEAELPRGAEREGHDAVADDAGDGRAALGLGLGADARDEGLEAGQAGGHGGVAERGDVLRGVGVGEREAVVDGREAEPRRAVQRAWPPRAQVTPVVELVVDEGDVEAAGV
ncbi:hypothetical protein U9M48_032134 [Paspalum notatum var. saurae]|uniref:Uncharacterized protein n=1 Tax=Paspalum notatum var. saurae TaxID=547442 RepID=A0AAQ3U425_PASNO